MAEFPDMNERALDGLSRVFRYFGEIEAPRLDSAVYRAISLGVANDPELLHLAAGAMEGQPPPNVLYASVHDRLLRDAEAGIDSGPLARWYPSVSKAPIPDTSPFEAFRAFCRTRRAELEPVIASGRTQTCVVHRSAVILPALACLPAVAASAGRVGLLEIGPSVGLNLRLDHYAYVYRGVRRSEDGTDVARVEAADAAWGEPEAQPQLRVANLATAPPPLPERLEVAARRGLELNPLDPEDPDVVRWLRALIWPEHVARAEAMDAALSVAARVPAEIHEGDATLEIEAHVRALPADAARVVFATQVFYQIPKQGRRAILDGLARASAEQPVDLLSMESSGEGDSVLLHFACAGGERGETRELARVDSHGRSIDFRGR